MPVKFKSIMLRDFTTKKSSEFHLLTYLSTCRKKAMINSAWLSAYFFIPLAIIKFVFGFGVAPVVVVLCSVITLILLLTIINGDFCESILKFFSLPYRHYFILNIEQYNVNRQYIDEMNTIRTRVHYFYFFPSMSDPPFYVVSFKYQNDAIMFKLGSV